MKNKPGRPNILRISFEDTYPYYGCYGDPVARTPRPDRLAGEGCLYPNAFSTAPVCEPAAQRAHDHLYFEYQNQLAVRRGDWKFFRFDHDRAPISLDRTSDDEALFHLADDRHEDRELKAA